MHSFKMAFNCSGRVCSSDSEVLSYVRNSDCEGILCIFTFIVLLSSSMRTEAPFHSKRNAPLSSIWPSSRSNPPKATTASGVRRDAAARLGVSLGGSSTQRDSESGR